MPTMNPNVLMLNNATVAEITAPIALAALGSSSQPNSTTTTTTAASSSSSPPQEGLVQKLITRYIAALKRERTMFLIFLGIWLFVALCAIGIILWTYYGRPAMREWRRRRYLAETGLPYSSSEEEGNLGKGGDNNPRSSFWRSARRQDLRATPWVPPKDGQYDEKNGAVRASFLQDVAVADAYLSSSSSNGDHSNAMPYGASSNYPSRSQIHISEPNPDYSYQQQTRHLQADEPPSTADILRDFTPLQTPRTQAARNLQYQQESALRETASAPRRLTVDSFMYAAAEKPGGVEGNAERESEGKGNGRKSNWLTGLAWGAVSGKLRNDARRTTMRDPYAFDNAFGRDVPSNSNAQVPHSQFGEFFFPVPVLVYLNES